MLKSWIILNPQIF